MLVGSTGLNNHASLIGRNCISLAYEVIARTIIELGELGIQNDDLRKSEIFPVGKESTIYTKTNRALNSFSQQRPAKLRLRGPLAFVHIPGSRQPKPCNTLQHINLRGWFLCFDWAINLLCASYRTAHSKGRSG